LFVLVNVLCEGRRFRVERRVDGWAGTDRWPNANKGYRCGAATPAWGLEDGHAEAVDFGSDREAAARTDKLARGAIAP